MRALSINVLPVRGNRGRSIQSEQSADKMRIYLSVTFSRERERERERFIVILVRLEAIILLADALLMLLLRNDVATLIKWAGALYSLR